MNFSNILSHIATVEPEVYEQSSPRRDVLKNWMRGLTAAAVPLAIGGLSNKAYSKTTGPDPIVDALNLLLKFKYMERDFYQRALGKSVGPPYSHDPLIPSGLEQSAITEISGQELKHTQCLRDNINKYAAGQAIDSPVFDFTAGGAFPTIWTDYDLFLAVAQTLEDTGVRAFKSVFTMLVGKNDLLSTVLRVHSTEARHAAHIRGMRRDTPSPLNTGTIKPWITGNLSNIMGPSVQTSYNGEDNTLQANIQITNINGLQINSDAASESFDEPLDLATVEAIMAPFIAP